MARIISKAATGTFKTISVRQGGVHVQSANKPQQALVRAAFPALQKHPRDSSEMGRPGQVQTCLGLTFSVQKDLQGPQGSTHAKF